MQSPVLGLKWLQAIRLFEKDILRSILSDDRSAALSCECNDPHAFLRPLDRMIEDLACRLDKPNFGNLAELERILALVNRWVHITLPQSSHMHIAWAGHILDPCNNGPENIRLRPTVTVCSTVCCVLFFLQHFEEAMWFQYIIHTKANMKLACHSTCHLRFFKLTYS